jgi:hypothetical protein
MAILIAMTREPRSSVGIRQELLSRLVVGTFHSRASDPVAPKKSTPARPK